MACIPSTDLSYTLTNPAIGVFHHFMISSVNNLGEGPKSVITEGCYVDEPPCKPSPPEIIRMPFNTVMVQVHPPTNNGTPVQSYQLIYYRHAETGTKAAQKDKSSKTKSGHESKASSSTTANDQAASSDPQPTMVEVRPSDLCHVFRDLEPDRAYRFQVVALNGAGESEPSDFSEAVILTKLLPTPPTPSFEIQSGTSVKITLADPSHFITDAAELKRVTGYTILASRQPDMSDAEIVGSASLAPNTATSTAAAQGQSSTTQPSVKKSLQRKTMMHKSPIASPMSSDTNLAAQSSLSQLHLSHLVQDLEKGANYYIAIQCTGLHADESSLPSPSTWVPLASGLALPSSAPEDDGNGTPNGQGKKWQLGVSNLGRNAKTRLSSNDIFAALNASSTLSPLDKESKLSKRRGSALLFGGDAEPPAVVLNSEPSAETNPSPRQESTSRERNAPAATKPPIMPFNATMTLGRSVKKAPAHVAVGPTTPNRSQQRSR